MAYQIKLPSPNQIEQTRQERNDSIARALESRIQLAINSYKADGPKAKISWGDIQMALPSQFDHMTIADLPDIMAIVNVAIAASIWVCTVEGDALVFGPLRSDVKA